MTHAIPVVYIDETGFESSTERRFAWARRGQRVVGYTDGRKRQRTSLIGGYFRRKLIAPLLYEGTCNTTLFNTWLEQQLMPVLPHGTILILDNATFHKSTATIALVNHAGHRLLFLPPYSPHLNPIEKLWANLKRQWQYQSHLSIDTLIASSTYLGD